MPSSSQMAEEQGGDIQEGRVPGAQDSDGEALRFG